MENLCLLDILKIKRPVPESCFSELQINKLFEAYRTFMIQKFSGSQSNSSAQDEVNRLYNYATTVEQKYHTLRFDANTSLDPGQGPVMEQHEKQWVNALVTDQKFSPFIMFLRQNPQLMENLRMAFKPVLDHRGPLTVHDMIAMIRRYKYWFQRQIQVITVSDLYDNKYGQGPTSSLLQDLAQNWASYPFHLVVLKEGHYWRAILIDREGHTFEYYDPLATNILESKDRDSVLSLFVHKFYETALKLDGKLVSHSLHKKRRGAHLQPKHAKQCGLFILHFLHFRLVLKQSFEQFVDQDLRSTQCRDLRAFFFDEQEPDTPKIKERKRQAYDPRLKFGAYEYRLAVIQFNGYLDDLGDGLKNNIGAQQKLLQAKTDLENLALSPVHYYEIRARGMSIQRELMALLPREYKIYIGVDIWSKITQQIIEDKLTVHLRQIGKKAGSQNQRSQSTQRKNYALKIWRDLTGWMEIPGATKKLKEQLKHKLRAWVAVYREFLTKFNSDNNRQFPEGLLPETFLKQTMGRQETVSFGVHFLRMTDQWMAEHQGVKNETLNQDFPVQSELVVALTPDNFAEIDAVVTQCQATIKKARQLLERNFEVQWQLLQQTNKEQPDGQLLGSKIDQIEAQAEKAIRDHTFYNQGNIVPTPWNLPLNIQNFYFLNPALSLPSTFTEYYSLTHTEQQNLLARETFQIYYAIGIYLITATLRQSGRIPDPSSGLIPIMLTSLLQFYEAAATTTDRQFVCLLVNELKTVRPILRSFIDPFVLERLDTYAAKCQYYSVSTLPVMQKAHRLYEQLASQG